ncbi:MULTISPECIES: Imm8 family immunity protein [Mesorhizobium]|uniref:Imm8 family immunity protein n=1 Tax=Mesorhizobium TaxID=68287 RepID=UPI0013141C04|nr:MULTISPECIES: Imm8 family immunity protein [Mesorhizobium]
MIKVHDIYSSIFDKSGQYIDFRDLPKQADVHISVRLIIGFDETPAADIFDVDVVTGRYAEECRAGNCPLPNEGRVLCFDTFDPLEVEAEIYRCISQCDLGSYEESNDCLRRVFFWEFEGM